MDLHSLCEFNEPNIIYHHGRVTSLEQIEILSTKNKKIKIIDIKTSQVTNTTFMDIMAKLKTKIH